MQSHPALHHPTNPFSRLEDHAPMLEPFRLSDTDHLVHDRIHELQEIATELRVTPRLDGGRPNVVTRTRAIIGRRLMSLGNVVAGQHAA